MANVTTTVPGTGARTLDPVDLYRTMLTARTINDTLKARKTQGRIPFYIGSAGHETCAAAVPPLYDKDRSRCFNRTPGLLMTTHLGIHTTIKGAKSRRPASTKSG